MKLHRVQNPFFALMVAVLFLLSDFSLAQEVGRQKLIGHLPKNKNAATVLFVSHVPPTESHDLAIGPSLHNREVLRFPLIEDREK
jgi:hypothetical protein